MNLSLTEDHLVEHPAINWFKEIGYSYIHGSELSPENGERDSYRAVILKKRFIQAIMRINSGLNESDAEKVYKKITELEHPDPVMKGKIFYDMMIKGVKIKIRENNKEKTKTVKLIDFENPYNNEFLIANQFTVEYMYERESYRRPDLVVFINGIPIAVFEFKNFNADETAKDAFKDHKVKMKDIPQLYVYSQILGASDGLETKYGSPTSDWDRFFMWEGMESDDDVKVKEIEEGHFRYFYKEKELTSLELLIKGLFRKEHIIEYLNDFIYYDGVGETFEKKIAMFHQFYTVKKAIKRTLKCVLEGEKPEDRRIGVVWHTQGTGKSLTMLFYARKVLKIPELENPLLLFITDRFNLDEQLSEKFSGITVAERAKSIKHLQELIKTKTGGIIFATIQKFGKRKAEEYPFLTDRKNIIVVADEAHRSQYKELAMNLRKAIPNASFMGFTATPVDKADRSTTLVFGEPISIYTMDKARRHKVIVPVYYEARLPELHLTNEFIDEEFETLTEGLEDKHKNAIFRRLEEKILRAEDRMDKIAKDIVEHFNKRASEFKGKALVVTISRKAAVELYKRIIKQPNAPSVVVVMSGDKTREPEYREHIRNKREMKELRKKFVNPDEDPQMAIVIDMWLTGFDVPCLHTMYFDKPMKDYALVQAIARVNRVFNDKPGGLIVDYIGIADDLRKSLTIYTLEQVREVLTDISEVLDLMKEKYEIVTSFFHGIDYKNWKNMPAEELAKLTAECYDRIAENEEKKKKFVKEFVALKKLYLLASPHPSAYEIKDDINFFEMIKKMVVKYTTAPIRDIVRNLEYDVSALISKSISAKEPVDVFSLVGKEKPDVSIFDENFLKQFKEMKLKNFAAELLIKILRDELRVKMKINPYRYKSLYEALQKILEKYNKKILTTAEIIEMMIELARDFKKTYMEGKETELTEEELAFYDMINSLKYPFNDEEVKRIAREIVKEMGYYIKIADWNRKDQIKAKIRVIIKKILVKVVDARIKYDEIDKLSNQMLTHAEQIYAMAA